MSLRGAILGFLSFEPTSGYTLKQRFDGSVRSFWSATQSQIYRELHARYGNLGCVLQAYMRRTLRDIDELPKEKPSVRLFVRGEVDSVGSSSIAVKPSDGSATQTCAIGSRSPRVDRIGKGDRVEMTCVQLSGTMTLVTIRKRR